jgi:hypothetical protein
MSILLPNSPEFNKILKASNTAFKNYTPDDIDMSTTAGASAVAWIEHEYKHFTVHYAVIPQNEDVSKLVYHFKKISTNMAERLGRFFYMELREKMQPRAAIQVGPSPLFRNQWDLILFHVPAFEAPMLHDRLLKLIEGFVGDTSAK